MTTYTHAKPAGTPTWSDLLAPDVDAARAFYHAVFGWDYDIGGPEYGGYTTARLGTRMTVGMSGPPPGVALRPAAWALYFATEDITADVARAVKLGAKMVNPPMVVGEFGSMATLEDPTGAAFSFWQAGQHVGWQVTDEPGSTTWYELYTSDSKAGARFLRGAARRHRRSDARAANGVLRAQAWREDARRHYADRSRLGRVSPQWASISRWPTQMKPWRHAIKHGGKVMFNVEDSPFGRLASLMDPGGATFKIIQPPTG